MKNGSLTRQHIRDKYANKDWDKFSELLSETNPGNGGHIGFYFLEREIAPFVKGFRYFSPDSSTAKAEDWAPAVHVRAVIESQFMLVYLHSRTIGFDVKGILATGGGSKNRDILQILSDIFGVPVLVGEVAKSAALGAAYRALHGWHCQKEASLVAFPAVVGEIEYSMKIETNSAAHSVYMAMFDRYTGLLKTLEPDADPTD